MANGAARHLPKASSRDFCALGRLVRRQLSPGCNDVAIFDTAISGSGQHLPNIEGAF
jgi:hypothetical protein